ncbi:ABC transporter ATP-binding protein [Plesiomonas shigelloides]|uniref:AAA family ATPase n=1 Tax=Plesiomonas shigelloides TaxID=703 RepID=UPI000D11C58B|nr:AAA family ATPase [Plesiomonas shigelloides]AVQ88642.1 ABC transporter ATP-binding protein [Plesiomonas shigelloides]
MFKIQNVQIDGFWQRYRAACDFNDDVNIIIGKNGTGKTTFMNILHAILSVDIDAIENNDFESVVIKLKDDKKIRTIRAEKINDERTPFPIIKYQISRKNHFVRLISSDDKRYSLHYRRRASEESNLIRIELSKLVSLSSLSVYRLRSGEDFEVRDKHGFRPVTPVDFRLSQLLQQLTHYQLDLSQQARDIATNLQKEVLASILYSKEDSEQTGYGLDFNKEKEKENLISAYNQLNAGDIAIKRKINFHVDAIDKTVSELKKQQSEKKRISIDFRSLEAYRKTQKIITMSLRAEKETSLIFSPISLFTNILSSFITDKKFKFIGGELEIHNGYGVIDNDALSSGEKQLLILFIETLLQRSQPYVFLTDEPELSLHIAWQRKIIPAIKELNPNAQIIAATHSPEVASRYRNAIFDMEKVVHG